MRKVIISTIAATFLAAVGSLAAQAAASACKGLDETACSTSGACVWRKAVTAGQSTKAGTPAVRNVKAHCRKAPAKKTPAS